MAVANYVQHSAVCKHAWQADAYQQYNHVADYHLRSVDSVFALLMARSFRDLARMRTVEHKVELLDQGARSVRFRTKSLRNAFPHSLHQLHVLTYLDELRIPTGIRRGMHV